MNTQQKGFTLIELLIVLGILGTLVVAVLVTLNPGEAQKKARDQKRMRDLATLQTIIDQYLSDGGTIPSACDAGTGCESTNGKTACGDSWITGANLCKYANSIPIDPNNSVSRTVITDGSTTPPTTGTNPAVYRFKWYSSDYEINARQESTTNASNVINDGGNEKGWVEVGTKLTLIP